MNLKTIILLLVPTLCLSSAISGEEGKRNTPRAPQDDSTILDASVIQRGSQLTGLENTNDRENVVPSRTSKNNFINYCYGKALTNGTKDQGGSCNGIPMGDIPSFNHMVSTLIHRPAPNEIVKANEDLDLTIQINNLATGHFTNTDQSYFSAPQFVNKDGIIEGHVHFTVEYLGPEITPKNGPLDPREPAFFKGVRIAADKNGILVHRMPAGRLKKKGFYRFCTMTAAANHQPVIMPVARRGSQDDCNKFWVE
ncbi:hypothetical protein AJ79_07744 [Helicocarpus griseus UAMH5409]|uniref:Intradiol ring-cleavage dioxygenases domain-containing protein n=1 Tax=Helicocarpus griseus UAMH5409 TaxID=1447875 RepID=A0A2B7WYW7_9EURO|nr:hypothetical protein AJ79_07744 [Helicocarpus griseus UAMH5409]